MSNQYSAIGWNRQKRIYDAVLFSFVALYLGVFSVACLIWFPEITAETLVIRATSTLAILMLHVILMIGPMARINEKFLPLLYNRRHLGVTMFFIAAIHGTFSIIQFHALGNISPIVSLFTSNTRFGSLTQFPFQSLGFFALIILMLMAFTSHDFWLNVLTPKVWKSMHMMVYAAYALIVMHVMLGVLQYETSIVYPLTMLCGVALVISLHLAAGLKELQKDKEGLSPVADGFVHVCDADEIPEKRAKIVCLNSERIAVFRYDGKISAVSNVCKHQNGPLGEGKIIDGCITCPWHGYQYLPHNGQSPPPFKEKVATFHARVVGNSVQVNPRPNAEGTEVAPALIPQNLL